jgi:hypothetical protein
MRKAGPNQQWCSFSISTGREDVRPVLNLSNIVTVMRTLSLVHQDSLEIIPDVRAVTVRVRWEELSHIELERVRDGVLRFASREVLS